MAVILTLTLALGWAVNMGGVLRPFFGKLLEERVDVALHMARQVEASEDPRREVERLGSEVGVESRLGRRPPREMVHRARVIERSGREILVLRAAGSPIAVPLTIRGDRAVWLMVWFPADQDAPRRKVGVGLLLLGLIAVVGALGASRWMLQPLELARDAMRRIADGDLAHRAPTGADAAGDMGATFNQMAERVEGLVQGQRDLMAAVSHELRTPLSRLRLHVELLRDEGVAPERLAAMEADVGAVDELVEELLESARMEQGVMSLVIEDIPIEELFGEALGAVELGEREVSLGVPDGLRVSGDRRRLLRVITNLLSNVVRYTPPGAGVSLEAAADAEGVALSVRDRGPGVAAADLPRLFDPFFRAEASRSKATGGLGLGLMLVRQIAVAHGGRATASCPVGGGLSVTVWLPRALAMAASEG